MNRMTTEEFNKRLVRKNVQAPKAICDECVALVPESEIYYDRSAGHVRGVCQACKQKLDPNPALLKKFQYQISLDFCMWVQANFDELMETLGKGIKVE